MHFIMEINTSADQSGAMHAMVLEFPGDDPSQTDLRLLVLLAENRLYD
jgi:hypothetical protein